MDPPAQSIRGLAQRLLTLEATGGSASSDAHVHEAMRVLNKLRDSITRLAGSEGFTALLQRAFALARAEVPSLEGVKMRPDFSLEGLEEVARNDGTEAVAPLISYLLGLLVTFVGQSLTLRLVREEWPDAYLDE